MSSRPVDSKNNSARVASAERAKIIAAQWQIRAIAQGKPEHIRHAAMTAVLGLKCIARGRGSPSTYRAVAEKIEMLKQESKMEHFAEKITIGDKYGPAMELTEQVAADAYFERCVEHQMRVGKSDRTTAEGIERQNLGYYAGYYDDETRRRVERLFKCSHPVFGAIEAVGAPTPEEALQAGRDLASPPSPGLEGSSASTGMNRGSA